MAVATDDNVHAQLYSNYLPHMPALVLAPIDITAKAAESECVDTVNISLTIVVDYV